MAARPRVPARAIVFQLNDACIMADHSILYPKAREVGKSRACQDCKRRKVKVRQENYISSTHADFRRSAITENQHASGARGPKLLARATNVIQYS